MHTISATEAKNHLASVMARALKEPVIIEKNGRPTVVMMSVEAYDEVATHSRKKAFLDLCDGIAATAQKNGMTDEILQSILASDK